MSLTNNENTMWRSAEGKEREKYGPQDQDLVAEFPASVSEMIDKGINHELDRKKFLTIMSASLAMATVKCSIEPNEKIVPYFSRPPEAQPGIPAYYATAKIDDKGVLPVLVKTREGKPIKVDGHDDHPVHKGAMNVDGFASIWEMYDPDRLKSSVAIKDGKTTEIATSEAISQAKGLIDSAKKVVVLSSVSYSPSENSVISRFLSSKGNASQLVIDSSGTIQGMVNGQAKSYGRSIIPQFRFDKADFVLSIQGDFLGTLITPELFTKQFSSRRDPEKKMNRMVAVESMMSLTGANADQRESISAGSHTAFALGIINQIMGSSSYGSNGTVKNLAGSFTPQKVAEITGIAPEVVTSIAKELLANRGRSIVIGGGVSSASGSEAELEILVNLINSILGNDGRTILSDVPYAELPSMASNRQIKQVVDDLNNGKVDLLILDRVNPVFTLPASSGIAAAIDKATNVIALADHLDESSVKADIVIALSHYMESWNDGYTNGVYSLGQSVIRTLYDTVSTGDAWLQLTGSDQKYYDYIQNNTAKNLLTGTFSKAWYKTRNQGFFVARKSSEGHGGRPFNTAALSGIKAPVKNSSAYTLVMYESIAVGDGKGANNAYRHELPDPVTKICWENYLAVSNSDAKANGWKMGNLVEVSAGDMKVILPIFIQPGLKNGTVAAAIGYGHENLGEVAKGLGENVLKLAGFSAEGNKTSGIPVEIKMVDNDYRLATTQRHHEMRGRGLARYTELSKYMEDKSAGNHEHHLEGKGLYTPHPYSLRAETEGYKWGMSIDLSRCTGCSACVLSCYSENNIPVTGKDEVWRGREMSWLRIDRYYEGEIDNPKAHFMPVMCQHCENAPCENVCPVNATTHSPEGLNDMAYNRCIGTRYCSDNCPFKVRRFNWFENWEHKIRDPQQLALNPDVTVRSRGVIEKCSMCVQRINEQRQLAKIEGREVDENDLKTACQQGCPADAITFGDLNNKKTKVSKLVSTERSYTMLGEVNIHPRINYLTRIINKG